ncbi:MAG: hypothetical protein QNK42_12925 [Pseudodonghicola sp.]|nr:hypothetical protein [Pseudodonghicola sp.]
MNARIWVLGCAALFVAACDDFQGANSSPTDGFLRELPEGVRAIAATNQDLTAVRVDPTDGCYVYRYRGPVETTYLPLRTVEGSPICTRASDAPVEG